MWTSTVLFETKLLQQPSSRGLVDIQVFLGSAFGVHVWSEAGKQNGEVEGEISGCFSSKALATQ